VSYIDSFDHQYIGNLGRLPLYRPLQNIHGGSWGSDDFSATPQNLVLGGGSGEHPALVIHQLPSLVTRFLVVQLSEEEEATLSEAERVYIDDLFFTDNRLEFCGWRVSDYAHLQTMAENTLFAQPLTDEMTAEEWIERSIGELVYYSLPDLNPEHQTLRTLFRRFDIRPTMGNITLVPPGYPACGGRLTENGRMKWGYHRWGKG